MGIKDKIGNLFKKGKDIGQCHQDSETGKVICKSIREHEDGTRQELAGVEFEFDGDCKGVATDMWENEPGELDKLEKKFVPRLQKICVKNKPQDY